MRSILTVIAIGIFLIPFGIPALLFLWVVGKIAPDLGDRWAFACVKGIMKVAQVTAGIRLTVLGTENIPQDRPALFTSNHRSMFDLVVALPCLNWKCGFVSKQELKDIPLFGRWIARIHGHFINRTDLRAGMKTIQDCIADVEAGRSIFICPEGTRNHGEGVGEFKGGSFRIAEKTGCPVIPVAITHADEVLENHFPWIRSTDITIEFAPPVETAGLDRAAKKTLAADVQRIVTEMYEKNF